MTLLALTLCAAPLLFAIWLDNRRVDREILEIERKPNNGS